jgi:hypothetical protein
MTLLSQPFGKRLLKTPTEGEMVALYTKRYMVNSDSIEPASQENGSSNHVVHCPAVITVIFH